MKINWPYYYNFMALVYLVMDKNQLAFLAFLITAVMIDRVNAHRDK